MGCYGWGMPRTSGTARRLFFSFALLVSIFVVGSYVTLGHLRAIRRNLAGMKDHVDGVRLALELASAVRDQYAHQAHTIILGDDSHLRFYEAARARVAFLTEEVRAKAASDEERGFVEDIERASAELDQVFRERIVPAVLKHDQTNVQAEHGKAQLLVSLIQERSDRLVERYEASISAYEAEVSSLQDETLRWALFFVAVAPLLSVAVGAYVLRSVATPIGRLREGASRLAQGDLATRIQVGSDDEFGALARQFNAMTEALQDHQSKLVQQEKLAGIGRLAAGVAHEINNPLAVILGYARLLRKKAEGLAADDLKVIEDETLRAKQIVDDLLDLSRPVDMGRTPWIPRRLCDEIASRLFGTPPLSAVRVSVEGQGRVAGNALKLRQVVVNLLKNAAEAAGPGGTVAVRIEPVDFGVALSVSDSGPGLSDEVRARLFEPFFTRKAGGTGLGLAVSKGIVEAHGGALEAESSPGGGARFTLRLPARVPAPR